MVNTRILQVKADEGLQKNKNIALLTCKTPV